MIRRKDLGPAPIEVSRSFGDEKPSLVTATEGTRVQISPHLDLWVRGARYGTIVRGVLDCHGRQVIVVRMDHPKVRKLQRFFPLDLTVSR